MHEKQLYHKKIWIFGYLFFLDYSCFVYHLNGWLHILHIFITSNKAPIICFCLEAQNNACGVINHVLF